MQKKFFSPLFAILLVIFLFCGLAHALKEKKIVQLTTNSEEALEYYKKESNNLSKFLEETSHIDFNHPIFSEILAKVVAEGMTTEEKLEKLYYFTRDTIPFDPSTTGLTASGALKEMKAICYTKAMIYVSFCRRLGVPANVALEEFIIKASPKKVIGSHGIAKIFYNGKWIHIDTVSNKEAWSWWDKKNSHLLEPPVFSLEHNVLVDERFVSNLTLKDFETNDVPEYWIEELRELSSQEIIKK